MGGEEYEEKACVVKCLGEFCRICMLDFRAPCFYKFVIVERMAISDFKNHVWKYLIFRLLKVRDSYKVMKV